MLYNILLGAIIPLLGTGMGALISFVSPKKTTEKISAVLSGFAGGVMVAASVWSLIIPAIDYSAYLEKFSFFMPCVGISAGGIMLIMSDFLIEKRSVKINRKKENLLYFAVTLHNIPEGMAIGAAYAAYVYSKEEEMALSALMLSIGIAIQNVPEGAIVSMPDTGKSRLKAFTKGVLSGVVEPIFVIVTVLLSGLIVPILPFMLSFAAGAMIYVVLKELVPEFSDKSLFSGGVVAFFFGFMLMMSLDVALG